MKNVTIYDIAKALDVNPSTVNRALSGKKGVGEALRERIIAYAGEVGYRINPAAKSLNRRLKIGLVMQHTVSAFEQQVMDGVEAAYAELAAMNVTLERRLTNTREEYEQACAALRDAGCDAMLLGPVRTGSLCDICRMLCEAGIPVGAVVSDVRPAERLFTVHLDGETTGRVAAELLYRFTGGGKAAVFTGDPDIPIHSEILSGFREFASNRFDVAAVYTDATDPDTARHNAKKMLIEHDDIAGIFVSTANSVPVCEQIAASGQPIQIVAMDVFDEVEAYLRRGVISALLYQQPRDQGYIALWNMVKFLDGYTEPKDVIIQPQVVMRSNIDAFRRQK
jgi:LacI family transcriptional regulator